MTATGALPAAAAIPDMITLRGLSGASIGAAVSDQGVGRPVVFLHGLAGLNDHWEECAADLRSAARCVLFELPLLELSGQDASVHGVIELTARFLEAHVGGPSVLIGNSFGGHVAAGLAIERPDLVSGLVLTGASGVLEKSMVREIQLRPSRAWLEERIGELFFDRSKMRASDVDRAHRELSKRSAARAMVSLSRSARRNHLGDQLGAIRAPTLIIWGREDVVTPPIAAETFHQRISGSRLIWFDRCGHAPMIECPDQFAAAVREFVVSLPAATT